MIQRTQDAEERSGAESRFDVGELVRHRRYGYRGVVVAFDLECQADEAWYEANQTQPPRDQPWYHVLVHASAQITYAAQTSLLRDWSDDPIAHPLVHRYFSGFENGRYVRNDRAWEGWS